MKKIAVIIYLFQLFTTIQAQNLKPKWVKGKWGFVDSTGKMVISPKYDEAWGFSDGLSVGVVKVKYYWGIIDAKGKELIAPKYHEVRELNNGVNVLVVKLNDKWGFVDAKGKETIPPKYDFAYEFVEGMAIVGGGGRSGFVDSTGKEITWKYGAVFNFYGGFAKVIADSNGLSYSTYGFIDKTGKEIIPPIYRDAGWFHEDLVAVKEFGGWGFIDKTGKAITPLKYDEVSYFSGGLVAVKKNDKWGFIDKTGNEIIPLKYDRVENFSEGLAAVQLYKKFGYIDKENNLKIQYQYDSAYEFKNGKARVVLNKTPEFIDKPSEDVKLTSISFSSKETILGNMVIEKYPDNSGTIVSIDNQSLNQKFINYKYFGSGTYLFDLYNTKVFYFMSGNKALKCSYTLSKYETPLAVTVPGTAWPGEAFPVPEILMSIDNKLEVINVYSAKKMRLPFYAGFDQNYNFGIKYDDIVWNIKQFQGHSNIDFSGAGTSNCRFCQGKGYTAKTVKEKVPKIERTRELVTTYEKREQWVYNPTSKTYEAKKNEIPKQSYQWVEKKGPDEIVEKEIKINCEHCKGKGTNGITRYLHWDGKKLSEISK